MPIPIPIRRSRELPIYTLNDGRSDREASALASRENQSDIIAGVDLSGENNPVAPILIDLAQRDTRNRSSEFATNALKSLGQVTDLLARSPHRSASLAVLVAPDVPAVLIELGYLSNNGDAAQMNSDCMAGQGSPGHRRCGGCPVRPGSSLPPGFAMSVETCNKAGLASPPPHL